MDNDELKLFIWNDFSPDFTGGLAFSIAKDAEEAMKLVEDERGYEVGCWGDLEIKPIAKIARSKNGGG